MYNILNPKFFPPKKIRLRTSTDCYVITMLTGDILGKILTFPLFGAIST